MTDYSKMSDDELQAAYDAASKPVAPADYGKMSDDELQAAYDKARGVTGPAGENPAFHQAVAETPAGGIIPGPTFAGRGLPGGTPIQKGFDLAMAGTPMSVGRGAGALIDAIRGGKEAATLAQVSPAVQNVLRNAVVGPASSVVIPAVEKNPGFFGPILKKAGKLAIEGLGLTPGLVGGEELIRYMAGGGK